HHGPGPARVFESLRRGRGRGGQGRGLRAPDGRAETAGRAGQEGQVRPGEGRADEGAPGRVHAKGRRGILGRGRESRAAGEEVIAARLRDILPVGRPGTRPGSVGTFPEKSYRFQMRLPFVWWVR